MATDKYGFYVPDDVKAYMDKHNCNCESDLIRQLSNSSKREIASEMSRRLYDKIQGMFRRTDDDD